MNTERSYYFDVLPIRFRPAYLESSTSFLTRLAERNHILSVDALTAICFPLQDRRITRELADYPPDSLEVLARVVGCSETILLGTTFFHLGAKFGRSSKPQALSRFLNGSIASYLRYCPLCLGMQQYSYYPLTWRFLCIRCCPLHSCKLLDSCGHCGSTLPLLMAPLEIGKCTNCGQSLQSCQVEQSIEEENLQALMHYKDIEFLLSPLPNGLDFGELIRFVGLQFKYERKMQDLTALEIASRMRVTLTAVEGIERGDPLRRGAKFQNYVEYAKHLAIPLRDVFIKVLDGKSGIYLENKLYNASPTCPTCTQRTFVVKFGHNHSGSQRYRCQYCKRYFTPIPNLARK
jgi:DNA-binding XRE family transcriptional regulator